MGRQMRLGMVGTDIVHASQYETALKARPSDAPAQAEMEHPIAPSATFQREVNV